MNLNEKNILITGGTGSFGKACVQYILKNYKPNKLVIFSRDELKQFEMAEELQSTKNNNSCLRFFLGDVRDKDRLDMAIKRAKTHLEGEYDKIATKKELLQNSNLVNPKSRLNKLTGKKLIDDLSADKRVPLLSIKKYSLSIVTIKMGLFSTI